MTTIRRAVLFVSLALVPLPLLAVAASSDMAVTASDSPDPVAPDGNITYTVVVTNNGPSATTNAHMSVVLNGTLLWQSMVVPAGWTCPSLSVGYGGSFTCTAAVMAVSTSTFTIVLNAPKSTIGSNDTTLSELFTVNSDNPDPNNGNNAVTVQTAYVAPHSDMSITASDSPDPVAPDGNITYTVNVTNGGPDAATNAHMSVVLNGTLLWQSMVVPAGWTCPSLSVGHGGSFTCTAATMAATTSQFSIVLKAAQSTIGINDTTLSEIFTTNSDNADPNNANNAVTVQTAYHAPHSDMSITASDSPDPVAPDGNITYTVNVTNGGPDTATNAHMSVVLNGTLLWQSMVVPAGWTCPSLSVGHGGSFTCTAATMAATTSQFSVVLKAAQSTIGINDTTLSEIFTTSSDNADPNNANNAVTVQTAYHAPHSDMSITASDSPDPVAPDGNITYTVTVTNGGPDAATNASMSVVLNNTLLWQSMTVPAGWSCPPLAVGHGASFTCTAATLEATTTSQFTIVLKAGLSQFGNMSQTITETFTTGSANADSNNANNAASPQTAYVVPQADLASTNSDSPDPVNSGANITYAQTVTNNGPDAATNVSITQLLPASVGFVSFNAPAGFSCTTPALGASGAITCTTASLANGATANFTLVVKALALSGTVTLTLSPTSAAQDPVFAGTASTAITTINTPPSADLSLLKTTGSTRAVNGTTIVYTLTVSNAGPSPATNVVVTDPLPASLQFVSATPSQGSCTGSSTIVCSLGTLANGASATITLSTRVVASTGMVSNSASVTAAENDPSGTNNGSSAPGIPAVPADAAPTMSGLTLIALAALLGTLALLRMR
jgi:uncharacterized repeat protein (TIGR01451 family)